VLDLSKLDFADLVKRFANDDNLIKVDDLIQHFWPDTSSEAAPGDIVNFDCEDKRAYLAENLAPILEDLGYIVKKGTFSELVMDEIEKEILNDLIKVAKSLDPS
jgi:hypothetical protein